MYFGIFLFINSDLLSFKDMHGEKGCSESSTGSS